SLRCICDRSAADCGDDNWRGRRRGDCGALHLDSSSSGEIILRSMILAAGFGTRLRPITYTIPKLLFPVRNKPLIAYAVESYLRAGVDDIIVNLHHLPDLLERYLTSNFDCTFHFSREEKILGSGGALRRVRHLLEHQEQFFLVNADTIQSPPFAALARARGDALAALTLRHPPANDKFTPVWFENGR